MASSKAAQKVVEEVENAVAVVEAVDAAVAPYLNGEPYNAERLINEVEFYHKVHASSAYEVGRRLIVLKATLEHGQFAPQVIQRIGISNSHASHLMAFARTITELSGTSNGLLDFEKLKSMDHRKVMLLGELAEEAPEELEASGTIGGRTLDEWDAKSRKELAAIVRKQQEKLDDGREQVNTLREKLEAQRDKADAILAADPNAVSMAVTRVGSHLRDALTDFSRTAVLDSNEDLPEATALDIVSLRANLRQFYDHMNRLIDERFPDVHEVPTDIDTTGAPNLLHQPMPTKGSAKSSAKVIDAN